MVFGKFNRGVFCLCERIKRSLCHLGTGLDSVLGTVKESVCYAFRLNPVDNLWLRCLCRVYGLSATNIMVRILEAMDAGLGEELGCARGGSAASVPEIQSRRYWNTTFSRSVVGKIYCVLV